MTIRLLDIHLTDFIEFWVGVEWGKDEWEFRVELGLWKLWFSLPIRWMRKE